MNTVLSRDGTPIAFERTGQGPALVLVSPATGTGEHYAGQAALHAPDFTVYTYDRRGRGGSGDTAPYAVAREIDDLAAVIRTAGGQAYVYGMSSGAVLALHTANAHPALVKKLALYEPPLIVNDARLPLPSDYVAHLNTLIAEGRRSDAVEYFLTAAIGLPDEYLEPMRGSPVWQGMERVAHTLAYDGMVMGDLMSGQPLPSARWPAATMPVLAMAGSNSEAFFHEGARACAENLAHAEFYMLEGQEHGVAPEALTPVLRAFFAE